MLNIPPELAQAPIAITHFGSSIWSYTCRRGAAILWTTRPEALMEGIVRLHEKVMAGVPPAYQIRGVAS